MKRRSFLIRLGGAVVAAPVALKLAGCSGSDDEDPAVDANNTQDAPAGGDAAQDAGIDAMASCTDNGARVAIITFDHGHAKIDIPADDINNPMMRIYSIKGTVDSHPHTITLTAQDFTTLAGGDPVTVTSSLDNAHTHDVTIVCV